MSSVPQMVLRRPRYFPVEDPIHGFELGNMSPKKCRDEAPFTSYDDVCRHIEKFLEEESARKEIFEAYQKEIAKKKESWLSGERRRAKKGISILELSGPYPYRESIGITIKPLQEGVIEVTPKTFYFRTGP